MAAQKEKFIQGSLDNGLPAEKAIKLWSLIEPFAAYGFNKAHAASYAMVAYQTAYMKATFPVEFMAAVLTAESDDNLKVAEAVAECRNLGIQVLPPDVNESLSDFTVLDDKNIRFGLSAIKNLGSDVIQTIISERKQNGAFSSLADFSKRVRTRNFNKKSWEALAKTGCLDGFGERKQMLLNTELVLDFSRTHQKLEAAGQSMLAIGNNSDQNELNLKPVAPATEAEKLSWEKELLGLYVSSHPLRQHQSELEKHAVPIKSLDISQEGRSCTVGGIVTRVQNILTKKGDQMCFADLEDLESTLELVVFPNIYAESKALLANDKIILVQGKISEKDGELKMLVDKITLIEDSANLPDSPLPSLTQTQNLSPAGLLKIRIPSQASPQIFSNLKTMFVKYPGETAISLVIPDREGTPREVKTNFSVENTDEFKTKLKELLRESIIKT